MANQDADIFSQLNNNNTSNNSQPRSNQAEVDLLNDINNSLKELLKSAKSTSQSEAKNGRPAGNPNIFSKQYYKGAQKEFTSGFEGALKEALLGSDFKEKIQKSLSNFAKELGTDLEGLPSTLGKELGKEAINALKKTKGGGALVGSVGKLSDAALGGVKKAYSSGVAKYAATHSGTVAEGSLIASGGTATAAGSALAGVTTAAATAAPAIAAVAVAAYTLGPALEGTAALLKGATSAAGRYEKSRERNLQLAQDRLAADVKTMVTEPFNILKESAQEVYNAWDKNVRLINGTQGYSKEDLQDLISSFAQRLRDEGLSSVVSSTDITNSLATVLSSGLSGKVAEEFAYLATKLNAAVPTQDFYGYAGTYASIAANKIASGSSQSDAIAYANEQMQLFASNILYANRQLSGGFSTGLKDAGSIFQQSVQIANASKTGNASQIAGVLTSVAAITGAIAPDLATSMTDAIYKAATGGNNSSLVALRSLAGINASNTEFLQAFAQNPQAVFSTLFSNLANMQTMSPGNYMEVAEGLSGVFGLSMDAFSRIDFAYLSKAISNMSVSTASLDQNMALLASGETTTTAEQLKMRQINEYMIDEGLSYVLDNQAARSIQEHMWDEQLNRELMEAEYAVNLKGSALEFLEGISHTIRNIVRIISLSFITEGVQNLANTQAQATAQKNDLAALLEAGKVGNGNAASFSALTTRNANLNLVKDIVSLYGGTSSYSNGSNGFLTGVNRNMGIFNVLSSISPALGITSGATSLLLRANNGLQSIMSGSGMSANIGGSSRAVNSMYNWGILGKSSASLLSSLGGGAPSGTGISSMGASGSSTAASAAKASNNFAKLLSTMNGYDSYEKWASSAKQFGIADLSSAITEAGYTEAQVKQYFADSAANTAAGKALDRQQKEEDFWNTNTTNTTALVDLVTTSNGILTDIFNKEVDFFNAWVDYFVNHTAYSASYKHSDVQAIADMQKEKSDDAIYALANALTANTVDLLDPTVQTNALLGEILKITVAIMQQNNSKVGSTLADTLSGLALGVVNP